MTVIISTVVASAAILMTGNSVADGNQAGKDRVVVSSEKNNTKIDVSGKESSIAISATTPPPPAGPFLGGVGHAIGSVAEDSVNVISKASDLSSSSASADGLSSVKPKVPLEPSAPALPVAKTSAARPSAITAPQKPEAIEKVVMSITKPASVVNKPVAEKITPHEPMAPKVPSVVLEKPQKVVKEAVEPSKVEKAINSFKPSAPVMEMTNKPEVKVPVSPEFEKEAFAPKASVETPKLALPKMAQPQMTAPEMKAPSIAVDSRVNKAPSMPQPSKNVQRPIPPQNFNQNRRPLQPSNMGNQMKPRHHFNKNNQQANNYPPIWRQKNYQPPVNGGFKGANNPNGRGTMPPAQNGFQGRVPSAAGINQYAPVYPSNYGYSQMPMWNGYYYEMIPYYWPLMPQKMQSGMADSSMQKQGGSPPVNTHKNTSSKSGKK